MVVQFLIQVRNELSLFCILLEVTLKMGSRGGRLPGIYISEFLFRQRVKDAMLEARLHRLQLHYAFSSHALLPKRLLNRSLPVVLVSLGR